MMTTTQTSEAPRFPLDPRFAEMRYGVPDRDGNIPYSIILNGLAVEEHACPPWELELRMELFVENMGKVC